MFEINPLCCRLKLPEEKRGVVAFLSVFYVLGSHHPDPGVWHSLWYYEDRGFLLFSIYRYIYIWEVMEPRAFEKCQMHFSTNEDDDDGNSNNDNNRTL